MKQHIKYIGMTIVLLMLFICLPSLVHAQPGPICPDPANCPIDGGLSFLIAVGLGYGIKKVREGKRKQHL